MGISRGILLVSICLSALGPHPALAQAPKAGVVTALRGQATVARATLPQPAALHFKDDVFFQDRVTTERDSIVKVLLGGKALLTIRELSDFSITEEPNRAVVDLGVGRLALQLLRRFLSPGESVEVHTPNAVASVRGSFLVTECLRAAVALGLECFFAALEVTEPITVTSKADPSQVVTLLPNQTMTVFGEGLATRLGPVVPIPLPQISAFRNTAVAPKQEEHSNKPPERVAAKVSTDQGQGAALLAAVLTGGPAAGPAADPSLADASAPVTTAPIQIITPPTPPIFVNLCVQCPTISQGATSPSPAPPAPNLIANGGFESGTFAGWTLSGAGSVVSSLGIFTPPEGNSMALIHTGTGSVGATTSTLTQSFSVGSVLLINIKYNFMTNEFPTQPTVVNDFFKAKFTDSANNETLLAFESRNSSSFTLASESMSAGGFTLSSGNGYTGFKSASKTVVASAGLGTLSFEVQDVGDTVVDSAALIDAVVVTEDPPLYLVRDGQTLTTPSGTALVTVSDQALTADSILIVCCPGPGGPSSATLGGPVLRATNGAVTVPFSLLGVFGGSTLITTSSDPLVWLEGGTHGLSTTPGTAIFDFWAVQTALDAETGLALGTARPLQHSGALLEASGATVTTQQMLKLDTALLEASAPFLHLTAGSALTTASDLVNLTNQAKLRATLLPGDALIKVDASTLTIKNGALLNVAGGSFVNITGSLVSLANGSTLDILNGALIAVSGGSVLKLTGGSLVVLGAGTNTLNITNTAPLCAGCSIVTNITNLPGIKVLLANGATAANVVVTAGLTPIAGLSATNKVNVSGASGAVLAVSGATSKVVLKP